MADMDSTVPPEIVGVKEEAPDCEYETDKQNVDIVPNGIDSGGDKPVTPDQITVPEEPIQLINVREKLSSRGLPSTALNLMFWDDLRMSAAVFTIGSTVLILLNTMSFISAFAYINLSILVSVWALKLYTSIQATLNSKQVEHPLQHWLEADISINSERLTIYIERFSPKLECFLKQFRAYLLFENPLTTIKLSLMMFFGWTRLGSMLNFLTLVLLMYVAAFTLPLLYEKKQKEINHLRRLTVSKVTEGLTLARDKIEPVVMSTYEKLPPVVKNPVGKFLKLESSKTE